MVRSSLGLAVVLWECAAWWLLQLGSWRVHSSDHYMNSTSHTDSLQVKSIKCNPELLLPACLFVLRWYHLSPRGPFQYPIRRVLVKSREVSIGILNYRIALKFGRHIDSSAVDEPVKFQSDRTIFNTNLTASRLCAI